MTISRRAFLIAAPIMPSMPSMPIAASQPPHPLDLAYSAGHLSWPGGAAPAACGRGGVRAQKREGDGATPAGTFPLVCGLYRADRVAIPPTALPMTRLEPRHAWVDDPPDRSYNRLVSLPYPAHVEAMWRQDGLYDLVVVIGYNTDPVVPGAGSAIFLHIAHPDFSPTEGCIAVKRTVLVPLVGLLGPKSTITIRP